MKWIRSFAERERFSEKSDLELDFDDNRCDENIFSRLFDTSKKHQNIPQHENELNISSAELFCCFFSVEPQLVIQYVIFTVAINICNLYSLTCNI